MVRDKIKKIEREIEHDFLLTHEQLIYMKPGSSNNMPTTSKIPGLSVRATLWSIPQRTKWADKSEIHLRCYIY